MTTPADHASPQSNGVSPRTFATFNARSTTSFRGCSKITEYDLMEKLGEGTFGEVYRAKSKKTGAVFALKMILMHHEKDGFPITALREIKILKLLSHPNVLKLEEMAVGPAAKSGDRDKKKKSIMYMVTPYMDHDLSGLLENPSVTFTVPQIKCYMIQLLEGVRYLHDNKILHRDMKAANLLINNKGILQIADFGLARHYDEPVPVAGQGGGEARLNYTTLVVTRWYRPPELLLHLRKYTTAIDLWGVGCVFGEMLQGKPILAGESDPNQLRLIFELVGSPTDENMPGWKSLPGAEGQNFPYRPSTLSHRFQKHSSGAISLLSELLKLDWRKRVNAIDALKHPYFRSEPLPAKPGDLPTFEESHELDRRKSRGQKAAPPPAPKGGTVGMANGGGWGEQTGNGNSGYSQQGDGYGGYRQQNGTRYPPHGGHRNGIPPPPPQEERRPAWRRDDRPGTLPPRPPPLDYHDGRGDGPEGYRSRSRDIDRPLQRSRGGAPSVDTYIPSYGPDGGHRRRHNDRDDRRHHGERDRDRDRERDRLEYDERSRSTRTRSRSRSPVREHNRERIRERDPLERPVDREREREREREIYRR